MPFEHCFPVGSSPVIEACFYCWKCDEYIPATLESKVANIVFSQCISIWPACVAHNYSCGCDLFRTSYEDWNRGVFGGAKGDKQVGFRRINELRLFGSAQKITELRPFPRAFFKATEMSSFFAYYTALSTLLMLPNESGRYTLLGKDSPWEYAGRFRCCSMADTLYLGCVTVIRHMHADDNGVSFRMVIVYTNWCTRGMKNRPGIHGLL